MVWVRGGTSGWCRRKRKPRHTEGHLQHYCHRNLRIGFTLRPDKPDRQLISYSRIFRETAVTTLLGLIRSDSASSQFLNPEITSGLPFIKPRYPSTATAFAVIGRMRFSSESSVPARPWNSVSVGPGHKQVTLTPVLCNSFAR